MRVRLLLLQNIIYSVCHNCVSQLKRVQSSKNFRFINSNNKMVITNLKILLAFFFIRPEKTHILDSRYCTNFLVISLAVFILCTFITFKIISWIRIFLYSSIRFTLFFIIFLFLSISSLRFFLFCSLFCIAFLFFPFFHTYFCFLFSPFFSRRWL